SLNRPTDRFAEEGSRFYVGGERACCLLCPEKCPLFTARTAHRRPTPTIRSDYRCKRHRHSSHTATGSWQRLVGATLRFAFGLLSVCVHACVHGMV
ncbi:unnamed protein product, partial [Closterium sp. NIES-54]